MRQVLAMSSWVSVGHVGLSAAAPALQRIGVETLQLPTVTLSNHNAWPSVAGGAVSVEQLSAMIDAIAANGWFRDVDAVLTGYLPSPEHVDLAAAVVARVRASNQHAMYVCDPVLGDAPKGLYVREETAAAIRETLAPIADVLTPNRFELGWLTQRPVGTCDDAAAAATALAGAREEAWREVRQEAWQEAWQEARERRRVLVTSAPLGADETGVIEATVSGARLYRTERRDGVPNGVGDVFAALIAGGLDTGAALGKLQALIETSLAAPHLRLVGADWADAAPIAAAPIARNAG